MRGRVRTSNILIGMLVLAIWVLAVIRMVSWDVEPELSIPQQRGMPIMECADGSWVDNREPGACFYRGGLPNE